MPNEQPVQNFKNHARVFPPYHYVLLPLVFFNFVWAILSLMRSPSAETGRGVLVAVCLVLIALFARTFALRVQDRVIRLEMRLRLRGILPPDLQPAIAQLTHRQLVALRFASDTELPELIREVVAGKLATQKDIKMRIKDWQSDWLRA